ncbi:recombination regulator RecX [Azoarcus sp. TTM-91]|uniref:recombination regulator RecX n=1 Tax=Azoarcus sp. TTM-91 TaxID=2691581 RepID=UPI00145D7D19|nr:recombination regulator RecX [Azoarcus sp. TTM-91]NMG34653.1 recombination regulator RecX [Azoarcus sp. TTM-91]
MGEPSLRERAIRLLARRDHSRAELARKLAAHGAVEEVEAVLDRMTELDLQSDRRYAEAWVRAKAARYGATRLRSELARRGLDRDTIEEALAAECPAEEGCTELERARAIWRGRFSCTPADAHEWARQARFLHGRGFSTEVIRKLLKENHDEPA